MLKEYLGLEKVIWLWRGMEGDMEVVNGAAPFPLTAACDKDLAVQGCVLVHEGCMKATWYTSCAAYVPTSWICSSGGC